MTVDAKPEARIVNPKAMTRKRIKDPLCRACSRQATNCHHLIGKGQSGDDVEDNLIPLCGSGSMGCHGALHGNPVVTPGGERRDGRWVRTRIGARLRSLEYVYVVGKLGQEAGEDYLVRRYHMEPDSFVLLRKAL